ncbi:MAG: S8 family peptidase [Gemmatimonas sp.]
MKISSREALAKIRSLQFVDYVEPVAIEVRSFSPGCTWPGVSEPFQYNSTYSTYVPQAFISSKIDQAWAGNSGQGVTIGLTDTGILPSHYHLMGMFDTGSSTGRTLTQSNEMPGTPTYCSHGSRMASVMAGPLNSYGTPGVAWKASLYSAIGADDVLGVGYNFDALRAVDVAGAKVVSMAWGSDIHSAAIADEIDRQYTQRDVLLIAAAGTTNINLPNNYVVFPGYLSTVLTVSAANLDGNRNGASHFGPQLDIVAYGPIGIPYHAFGYSPMEIGNSSGATAVVTGVAAMVRARYPTYTNAQVFNKLVSTAGAACGINSNFGPIVNALAAIGSFCGPTSVVATRVEFDSATAPPRMVTVTALTNTTGNNLTYQWSHGPTTPTIQVLVYPGTAGHHSVAGWYTVTVTDTYTGIQHTATGAIQVSTGPFGPGNCGGYDC